MTESKQRYLGEVIKVNQSLVMVNGLKKVVVGEVLKFRSGQWGQVREIEEPGAEAVVFSRESIKVGTKVAGTGSRFKLRTHEQLLGKVYNALGEKIVGTKNEAHLMKGHETKVQPAGIEVRERISQALETGVPVVDLMVPMGEGQRELLVGDRTTGKSDLALKILEFQVSRGAIGVYACIGKRKSEIMAVVSRLKKAKILKKCVVVAASSADSLGEIFEAPYAAMTISEYFMSRGKRVILVMDDLSTHAQFYRELALLGQSFPGRESYPGDIFYVHSSLLERAGNFSKKEGSISCLPICHTKAGDLTGYIPTNLMSMTDGHVYFDNELYVKGVRPAINPFLSVTRVGRQAQTPLRRELSRELLSLITQYEKTQRYTKFGAELSESFKRILSRGESLWRFLRNEQWLNLDSKVISYLGVMILIGKWSAKKEIKIDDDFIDKVEKLVDGCSDLSTIKKKLVKRLIKNVE